MSSAVELDHFFIDQTNVDVTKIIEDYKAIGQDITWRENSLEDQSSSPSGTRTFGEEDVVSDMSLFMLWLRPL